jgi:tetratricopeptide (TPR) repeat protein
MNVFNFARLGLMLFVLVSSTRLQAEDAGQADLDKAMEKKLTVESIKDLGEVIDLCRRAIAGGLDEANKEFAENLLMGTLVQRAEIICNQIFDQPSPPPQWPLMQRQALLDLEEATKIDGQQFDIHYMIGRLNSLPSGDRKRARTAIDEAINLAKETPTDHAKALVLRANIAENNDQRMADFSEAIKLAPENAEIVRSRGLSLFMEKKYDEALADLDRALELDPDHADTYEARGVILFLQGKTGDAIKAFDRAIELEPTSAVAYTHRARIFAIENEDEKAMEQLDKAIKLDPNLSTAYLLRARLLQQKGDKDGAKADLEKVLKLSPTDDQALQLRALMRAEGGQLDEAIKDLEQLRRADPDNQELLAQLAIFYTADKQPRLALDAFNAILKKDSENSFALKSRADLYLNLGKPAEAIVDYEAALKSDEEDSGALNNLAWLLATSTDDKLRDGERSIELAKKAARVTEFKQPHILSTLAAAYAETGDFENAMTWSKKAVELAEKSEDSKDIQKQLKEELASYEAKKPWREELKSTAVEDPEPEELPEPGDKPAP